ncbi:MAG: hypothetical protein [Bacteriophage sp.]|nr:MAG: hypothetical protein [Bacteriophage sp.]
MKGEKAMGMKGFKGFEKDFSCGGKQCEENTTYEEYGEGCCYKGVMHFYEDPWEVLNHYDLVDGNGNLSEFAEVEALGQVWNDGEKRATNKIHVGAKLGLKGFLKACIDFTLEKTKYESNGTNLSGNSAQIGSSGDYAQIGSSGDYAQIGSSGYYAQIGSSGDSAQIGSSGYSAQIGSSGYSAQIGSSGDSAQIGSSGDSAKIGSSGDSAKIGSSGYCAKIGSSGDCAKIGSSGDCAKIGSSGDSAQINSTGEDAVIMCAGRKSKAKGKKGSWITLVEWVKDEEKGRYVPICVKTERVDGEKIKEDTYYTLKNGEFSEVEE